MAIVSTTDSQEFASSGTVVLTAENEKVPPKANEIF